MILQFFDLLFLKDQGMDVDHVSNLNKQLKTSERAVRLPLFSHAGLNGISDRGPLNQIVQHQKVFYIAYGVLLNYHQTRTIHNYKLEKFFCSLKLSSGQILDKEYIRLNISLKKLSFKKQSSGMVNRNPKKAQPLFISPSAIVKENKEKKIARRFEVIRLRSHEAEQFLSANISVENPGREASNHAEKARFPAGSVFWKDRAENEKRPLVLIQSSTVVSRGGN